MSKFYYYLLQTIFKLIISILLVNIHNLYSHVVSDKTTSF